MLLLAITNVVLFCRNLETILYRRKDQLISKVKIDSWILFCGIYLTSFLIIFLFFTKLKK